MTDEPEPANEVPRKHGGYERLLAACKAHPPVRMAVVHPCSAEALEAVLQARDEKLIEPVLVAPPAKIAALSPQDALDTAGIELVPTAHSHASAAAAVALRHCVFQPEFSGLARIRLAHLLPLIP